jgi:hypothetical protein
MDDVTAAANPPNGIRIGNEERAAAQRALDEHLAAGRLEMDEFADRYAAAGMAHTRADLDVLFTDLPAPHPFTPALPRMPNRAEQWRHYVPSSNLARVVLAVLAVVAIFAIMPFFAAGALVWFVVIPMLSGRGPGSRYHRGWRY